MGEVFRIRNLRFCIFPMDHGPPHVHVLTPGADARFRLDDLSLLSSYGFKMSAVREISSFLKLHQKLLWEAWNENQPKK